MATLLHIEVFFCREVFDYWHTPLSLQKPRLGLRRQIPDYRLEGRVPKTKKRRWSLVDTMSA